jgi:hypothetical protein
MFAENAQRLSDGFEDALRSDLDRVLDALRVAAGDLTGGDDYLPKVSFTSFIRQQLEPAI